jgi:hypothetical protein
MERFNLKQLNEVEDKEQFRVGISNRFAALGNLDDEADINRAWETIRENTKFQPKTILKTHQSWFDERRSELLVQRKQAKLQWL